MAHTASTAPQLRAPCWPTLPPREMCRPTSAAAAARLTLVTNFEYVASGRDYAKEDLWLAAALRARGFTVATVHPNDLSERDYEASEHVLFRNTGPVTTHAASLARWRAHQAAGGDRGKLANNLSLKGDVRAEGGKLHLLELTAQGGYPVIEAHLVGAFLDAPPQADAALMIKPLNGADSVGLRRVEGATELRAIADAEPAVRDTFIVQRLVEFEYELSFYFVGATFVYALRTGGPSGRWQLVPHTEASSGGTWEADLAFARRFLRWNGESRAVVRVDGVRETASGQLLLMEIEDYNPYLSLAELSEATRERLVDALVGSLLSKPA